MYFYYQEYIKLNNQITIIIKNSNVQDTKDNIVKYRITFILMGLDEGG